MYTPVDIENKEFSTKLLGYDKNEVDEFKEVILNEFDRLYRENVALKDKVNMLSDAVKEYKAMENALQSSIMAAQNVAEEIKKNAYVTAENTVKEAETRAKEIIIKANAEISSLTARYEEQKREYLSYKSKIGAVINAQLNLMKDMD